MMTDGPRRKLVDDVVRAGPPLGDLITLSVVDFRRPVRLERVLSANSILLDYVMSPVSRYPAVA